MKKLILITAVAISATALGSSIESLSTGFVAPVVKDDSSVPAPAKGEIIFNNTEGVIKGYNGSEFQTLTNSNSEPVAAKFITATSTTLNSSGLFTTMDFIAADVQFDSNSALDHTNNKFVAPEDGIYMVSASMRSDVFLSQAAFELAYVINSGTPINIDIESRATLTSATYMEASGSTLVELSQNDDLYIGGRRTSGTPNISAGTVSIFKLRSKIN